MSQTPDPRPSVEPDQAEAPPTLRIRDPDQRPIILGTAREDIPRGARVIINPETGMIALYRPTQENP